MGNHYIRRFDLSKYTLKSFDSADEICCDTNNSDLLTYDANGVSKVVADTTSVQTLTGKTLGSSGNVNTAVVNLLGTAWHTGVGAANTLNWQAPAQVMILRVIILGNTVSSGAATVAAGTTAASNITLADNLIDDYDLTTAAPSIHDSMQGTDTETKFAVLLASGGWVTFTASADPTGFVGNAYIQYLLA